MMDFAQVRFAKVIVPRFLDDFASTSQSASSFGSVPRKAAMIISSLAAARTCAVLALNTRQLSLGNPQS